MSYTHSLPSQMSFDVKGLFGYTFGPLQQRDLEIYYIEVEKGHDTFIISKTITRIYYILAGHGYFTIAGDRYDVNAGMLVEAPPKVEYSYSGQMTLLAVSKPRWFAGNDIHTRWNPDVIRGELPRIENSGSWIKRLVRLKIFGKSPTNAYLRLNQRLWNSLPASITALRPIRAYGDLLHALARIQGARAQAFSTFFLRNRPQLQLIHRMVERHTEGNAVRVAVLGCSIGAEAYSVAWAIRKARPDLHLMLHAVDISRQVVEVGRRGSYPLVDPELTNTNVFDRMTANEMDEFFDIDGGVATVKSWIKDGIEWVVGDVGDFEIVEALGHHDIVVANNFLCHMDVPMAMRTLRNISQLVSPHGYLFVSGVDLEVRTRVADDLGWQPLEELLEAIHDGDPCLKGFWPCHYGGLEPLNKRRTDWRRRYAAAFCLVPPEEKPGTVVERSFEAAAERGISEAAFVAADEALRAAAVG